MPRRRILLTTDIGSAYAAQIRGVLARLAPGVEVADGVLDLTPHAVAEAGFVLDRIAASWPSGTVHLAVVDPGVGGRRAPIAVRTSAGNLLVGPDNGLLDRLAGREGVASAVRIRRERLGVGPRVGATFDGRDLFAPAAARLALGRPLGRLGPPYPYAPTPAAPPRREGRRLLGHLVYRDRFGNAITDLPSEWVRTGATVRFRIGATRFRAAPVVPTYEALRVGTPGVLASSFGTLEIARRERPFLRATRLGGGRRVEVVVTERPRPSPRVK